MTDIAEAAMRLNQNAQQLGEARIRNRLAKLLAQVTAEIGPNAMKRLIALAEGDPQP